MRKEGYEYESEVFLQQVWSTGNERATTLSLVMDVDIKCRDSATEFLLGHNFKGRLTSSEKANRIS